MGLPRHPFSAVNHHCRGGISGGRRQQVAPLAIKAVVRWRGWRGMKGVEKSVREGEYSAVFYAFLCVLCVSVVVCVEKCVCVCVCVTSSPL